MSPLQCSSRHNTLRVASLEICISSNKKLVLTSKMKYDLSLRLANSWIIWYTELWYTNLTLYISFFKSRTDRSKPGYSWNRTVHHCIWPRVESFGVTNSNIRIHPIYRVSRVGPEDLNLLHHQIRFKKIALTKQCHLTMFFVGSKPLLVV